MYLNSLKILNIKLTLSDVSKSELSKVLDVDPAVLSRDIKNKELLQKIDDYFNNIDPRINESVKSIISQFDDSANNVEESTVVYDRKNDLLDKLIAEKDKRIRELTVINARYERIFDFQENTIKNLENDKTELRKMFDIAMEKLEGNNKQTG